VVEDVIFCHRCGLSFSVIEIRMESANDLAAYLARIAHIEEVREVQKAKKREYAARRKAAAEAERARLDDLPTEVVARLDDLPSRVVIERSA
jgi:hypothetical protein